MSRQDTEVFDDSVASIKAEQRQMNFETDVDEVGRGEGFEQRAPDL